MSDQHQELPKTRISQVLIAILGSLIAPVLVLALIFKLVMGISASHIPDPEPDAALAQVEERVAPVGQVDVAEATGAEKTAMAGDVVYQQTCFACHGSGVMEAPKFGDKDAWAPRIAQGYDTLLKHALEGLNIMPPRGGNADLSDAEVANAVVYMANEAGAGFAVPSADAPAAEVEAPATVAAAAEPEADAAAESTASEATSAPTQSAAAVATEPVATLGEAGQQTYKAVCFMCHDTGLMSAPKLGSKDDWAPRIAQGKETLFKHAIEGIRMMPARGGNPGLSDEEVHQAVIYMANKSGANF